MIVRKLMVVLVAATAVIGVSACSDDDEGPTVETFTATLTGASEVPPVTTTATGNATVTFTTTGLSWVVNVTGITGVTLAHIHAPAAVGVNAGVVLNLNPNTAITTGVLTTGTATTTTPPTTINMDSLKVLIRNGLAYVNVHTAVNPGGAIRGQLVRAP